MHKPRNASSARIIHQFEIGILLFDGVEVLDFAGPYEVFSLASRLAATSKSMPSPLFGVRTIARSCAVVRARHGLRISPDLPFAQAHNLDLVIVPGGAIDIPISDVALLRWLKRISRRGSTIGSVCNGALIIGELGLLADRRATTHWDDLKELARISPSTTIVGNVPFVDEGKILSSAGISAGITMCLHLVERFAGVELALRTARQMEYPWTSQKVALEF